jgi:hypothetical protein
MNKRRATHALTVQFPPALGLGLIEPFDSSGRQIKEGLAEAISRGAGRIMSQDTDQQDEVVKRRMINGLRILALVLLIPLAIGFGLCGGFGLILGFSSLGDRLDDALLPLGMGLAGILIAVGLALLAKKLGRRGRNGSP